MIYISVTPAMHAKRIAVIFASHALFVCDVLYIVLHAIAAQQVVDYRHQPAIDGAPVNNR